MPLLIVYGSFLFLPILFLFNCIAYSKDFSACVVVKCIHILVSTRIRNLTTRPILIWNSVFLRDQKEELYTTFRARMHVFSPSNVVHS
jgi:hypothetical protein